jgi:hypothetical protein
VQESDGRKTRWREFLETGGGRARLYTWPRVANLGGVFHRYCTCLTPNYRAPFLNPEMLKAPRISAVEWH